MCQMHSKPPKEDSQGVVYLFKLIALFLAIFIVITKVIIYLNSTHPFLGSALFYSSVTLTLMWFNWKVK